MLHLSPYLFFVGNCREALTFYQSCLGGELHLQRFGDSPMAAHMPAEMQDKIMHGTLTAGNFTLMAADAGRPNTPLVAGNNLGLSLHFDNDAELTNLFERLGEGGTVRDPLTVMPWGGKFGVLFDRFGTKWLFHYQQPQAGA